MLDMLIIKYVLMCYIIQLHMCYAVTRKTDALLLKFYCYTSIHICYSIFLALRKCVCFSEPLTIRFLMGM